MSRGESLTALESAFLHVESPRTPMHMGSLGILEGEPLRGDDGTLRLDEVRSHVEARLDLVPKLRRKLRPAAVPGAPPVWVDDDEFDIANHVRAVGAPVPGGEAELFELCATLLSEPLDRTRPLWELWLIDGLADGRVALLEKLHHSVADGIAGVEVASLMFDIEPHPERSAHAPARWRPEPPPSVVEEVAQDVGRLKDVTQRWVGLASTAVRHPVRAAGRVARLSQAAVALTSLRFPAPRLSINRQIGPGRRVHVVRQSIESLREVEQTFGTTLNDVVLTAVAGGLGHLLEQRAERSRGWRLGHRDADDSEVQVLIPVGLQHEDGRLGNQVAALFARLPVGGEPLDRLHQVATRVRVAKTLHEELASELFLDLLAPVPQPLLAAAARLVHHQALVNLVVTNVPGPSVPLYALGARMVEAFPFVPLAGNLTIGVAALSYDGQLNLGILADRDTCPDAAVLVEGIEQAFADLRALVTKGRTARAAARRRSASPS